MLIVLIMKDKQVLNALKRGSFKEGLLYDWDNYLILTAC